MKTKLFFVCHRKSWKKKNRRTTTIAADKYRSYGSFFFILCCSFSYCCIWPRIYTDTFFSLFPFLWLCSFVAITHIRLPLFSLLTIKIVIFFFSFSFLFQVLRLCLVCVSSAMYFSDIIQTTTKKKTHQHFQRKTMKITFYLHGQDAAKKKKKRLSQYKTKNNTVP